MTGFGRSVLSAMYQSISEDVLFIISVDIIDIRNWGIVKK